MTPSLEGNFNPAVHFLGLIKKAISDGVARRCAVAGGPQLVIAPQSMTYHSAAATIDDLRTLCLAQPFDLQIEPLPDGVPEAGQKTIQVGRMRLRTQTDHAWSGMSPKPLKELLWYAAISASAGRLLEGCRADEPVRLKHPPDLSRLAHQESHAKLAQFMHESSADLLTVAKRTGVPLAQVYDFHNACAALGLVERGNVLEPEEYFLGLIQKSLRDGLTRRCVLPGLPPVFLVPKERRYYSQATGPALGPFYSANLGDMQVDVVDTVDLGGQEEEETIQIGRMMVRRKKEALAAKLSFGSLEDLLWSATLKASRGRLLAGKHGGDVVRLRRWPDFSRLPGDRRFLPLAAFMSVNAADLPTVAQHTGSPLSQVIDFHNACAALDFLEYLPEQRLVKRAVNDKEREIYRSISRSLGGIRTAEHVG